MFKNLNPWFLGVSGHESEIIELALTCKFRGMDLNIEEFTTRADLKGMDYARRLVDSAKILLGSFELPLAWDVDDETFGAELAKLPETARMAAEVGCTRCRATIAPAGDKRPYHENFEFHKHRFTDICKVLEPHGVRLGIGFQAAEYLRKGQAFQFIHEFEAVATLVNMVDCANFGLLLDTWNFQLGGGTLDELKKLPGEKIVVVQLADLPGDEVALADVTNNDRYLPGTTGKVDVGAILKAVAEMGYDGPVTAAPHRSTVPRGRRNVVVERTAQSLDQAWQAAGLDADGKPGAPTVTPTATAAVES